MKGMVQIYCDDWVLRYARKKIDEVSHKITNTYLLEDLIFKELADYYSSYEKRSIKRIRYIVDRRITQALERNRLQNTMSYSDLAVTNDFGESLEYEPTDEVTDVEENVERNALQRKIARLASDDFERYVLTAWSRGERSIDIAKDLAVHGNHDVAYFKLKVARFKTRCKKRWTRETFVS